MSSPLRLRLVRWLFALVLRSLLQLIRFRPAAPCAVPRARDRHRQRQNRTRGAQDLRATSSADCRNNFGSIIVYLSSVWLADLSAVAALLTVAFVRFRASFSPILILKTARHGMIILNAQACPRENTTRRSRQGIGLVVRVAIVFAVADALSSIVSAHCEDAAALPAYPYSRLRLTVPPLVGGFVHRIAFRRAGQVDDGCLCKREFSLGRTSKPLIASPRRSTHSCGAPADRHCRRPPMQPGSFAERHTCGSQPPSSMLHQPVQRSRPGPSRGWICAAPRSDRKNTRPCLSKRRCDHRQPPHLTVDRGSISASTSAIRSAASSQKVEGAPARIAVGGRSPSARRPPRWR